MPSEKAAIEPKKQLKDQVKAKKETIVKKKSTPKTVKPVALDKKPKTERVLAKSSTV